MRQKTIEKIPWSTWRSHQTSLPMTSVCVQQHRLCRKIVSVACMIKLRDKGVRCIAGRKSNAPRAVRNRVRKRQGRFITSLMASELLSFNAENKSWTIWEFLCCAALGPNLDVRNAQTCIIMKNRVETTTMILLMEINWFRSYYFFIAAPRNSLVDFRLLEFLVSCVIQSAPTRYHQIYIYIPSSIYFLRIMALKSKAFLKWKLDECMELTKAETISWISYRLTSRLIM